MAEAWGCRIRANSASSVALGSDVRYDDEDDEEAMESDLRGRCEGDIGDDWADGRLKSENLTRLLRRLGPGGVGAQDERSAEHSALEGDTARREEDALRRIEVVGLLRERGENWYQTDTFCFDKGSRLD